MIKKIKYLIFICIESAKPRFWYECIRHSLYGTWCVVESFTSIVIFLPIEWCKKRFKQIKNALTF